MVEEGLEEVEVVAEVEAVGQGVVDLDRVGQEEPFSVGKVLPPSDSGGGVGREADRMGDGGERDPGDRSVVDDYRPGSPTGTSVFSSPGTRRRKRKPRC